MINADLNNVFTTLAADLPKDFKLFLANGRGDYLIHPDASQTFGFDKGRHFLVQHEFAATRDLVEGSDGRYQGAPVVAAFVSRSVKISGDEDSFVIGFAQPLSRALERIDKLGVVALQLVLALCLLGVFIAALVARAVTRPINSMSTAVQNFALDRGRTEVPAVDRRDEIGVLAHSFKQMQDDIHQQLEALQESREELEHMARHDVLTGCPNRRAFQERLEHTLARAQRNGEHFAIFFIDVDNFKGINDKFGLHGGNAVLKIVALRLGGDEFVVLLESVRAPIVHRGTALQVGFSIGISMYPQDGRTAAELMARADRAMYEAKDAGRNGFRFSSGKTQPTSPTPALGSQAAGYNDG